MLPVTPFGNTVFCDDIRAEVGGKHSFMGVYRGELIVPVLPATLPTFGFVISYFDAEDEAGTDPIKLRILFPGDGEDIVAAEAMLPLDIARNAPHPFPPSDQPLLALQAFVQMTGVELKHQGIMKVRAYKGDEEIRLGSLRVRVVPPEGQVSSADASESANGSAAVPSF